MRATAIAAAFGSLVLACVSSHPSATPAGRDAAAERLYRGHCAACHRLLDPGEYTADWWARAVDWYGPEAHLTEEERRVVLGWLTARAKKPSHEDDGAR